MNAAVRGKKLRGWITVPGTDITLPYTDICGAADGPFLFVTGGTHGGEYPGIEAAIRLSNQINPATLKGRVLIIHMSNPPAFYAKRQYVSPLDEKNLNRVYPGNPEGSPTERVAAAIISLLDGVDVWIDLHGGDLHEALVPFTIYSDRGGTAVVEKSRGLAQAYGISHILESSSIAGGTYATAAEMGIPAILTESGQSGQLDESAVGVHVLGLKRVLAHLGMIPEEFEKADEMPVLRQFIWLSAPHAGLIYRSHNVGDVVQEGDLMAAIKDEFGDPVEEIRAPQGGVALFMVTSLAILAGEPVCAIAAP